MSAPFLLLSAHTRAFLLPGLPVAALMAFCPMLAALVVAWGEGRTAFLGLLRRAYDFRRITDKVWYVPILLFYPAITVLSYGAICWSGVRLPPPQIDVLNISGLAVAFFVAAMGEEIGWSGYATDRLQRRFGALVAALILGAIWAIYHVAALRLAHRAWS
jgi:membrane protease YdiL (CAAX protease family)